jgi:hypothetical protein
MPFGFPPLTPEEFEIIAGWLAQGARGPDANEQKKYTKYYERDIAKRLLNFCVSNL